MHISDQPDTHSSATELSEAIQPSHASVSPTPSTVASAPPSVATRKRRRYVKPLVVLLLGLTVLVVTASLLGPRLLFSTPTVHKIAQPSFPAGGGPYAQLPLSANEINAIQHLSTHLKYKTLANLYVEHMSLDEEIGQLMMVEYNETNYSSSLDTMINLLHVGAVIMYAGQFQTTAQARGDIAHMQQRASIPLLVATDEEGGYVERIGNIYGPRMSATQIAQTGNVNVATQQGLHVSQDLAALGVNVNLAPVVDVSQVSTGDLLDRTFGTTPTQVVKYAGAYLRAMQANGTIGSLKHFPGLGGAQTDPHFSLPVVNSSRTEIYNTDLAPFRALIQDSDPLVNPGMVMTTDVLLPAIDSHYPAELSSTFLTTILRREIGYDGVIATDALWMKGITDTWSVPTAAVMALQAGADMLLGADGLGQAQAVFDAVKQAVQNGQLTRARIDESVARIIALKMQYHVMPVVFPGM